MKSKIVFLSLFLLGSLSLFSQGGSLVNGGTTFNGYVLSCNEPVKIKVTYSILSNNDAIASPDCPFTIVAKGTGVGLWTGAVYQVGDVTYYSIGCAAGSSNVYAVKSQVTGQGTATGFILNASLNVAVGNFGQLVPGLVGIQGLCF